MFNSFATSERIHFVARCLRGVCDSHDLGFVADSRLMNIARQRRQRTGQAVSFPTVHLHLPSWLGEFLEKKDSVYPTRAGRVRLVIEMSRLNARNGTGGPFAAAIFSRRTNALLAPGVNVVVGERCSVAHAEMMAIMTAQRVMKHYDLGQGICGPVELVSSAEPCTMCQGAILWSGVSSLVYAARGVDACRIGFDEGPKAPDWIKQFKARGISVAGGVYRKDAVAVLRDYHKNGGVIYNSDSPVARGA